jgi:hypothetical protein
MHSVGIYMGYMVQIFIRLEIRWTATGTNIGRTIKIIKLSCHLALMAVVNASDCYFKAAGFDSRVMHEFFLHLKEKTLV